jgi:hypothetical protein
LKFIRVYSCQIAVYFDVKVPINSTQLMKDEILLADEERKCERITICVEPEFKALYDELSKVTKRGIVQDRLRKRIITELETIQELIDKRTA